MSSSTSAAAAEFARRRQSPVQRIQHLLHGHPWLSPLFLLVLTFVVFSILNPRFASAELAVPAVPAGRGRRRLAIGQTLIILTAGIDLSVGAITILVDDGHGHPRRRERRPRRLALSSASPRGRLAGCLNGLLVTRVGLPPFIVTLGTLSIFTAIALLYSGGASIQDNRLPDILNWTGEAFSIGRFRVTSASSWCCCCTPSWASPSARPPGDGTSTRSVTTPSRPASPASRASGCCSASTPWPA